MSENDFGPIPQRPLSWADVFAITGGLYDVSIQEIEAGRVDWEYDFTASNMRHCGRNGCKQVHGHGWIVALRGGRFVHIGNDCARLHANLSMWDAKVAVYNERRRTEVQTETLVLAREKAQATIWWLDANVELDAAAALYRSFQRQGRGPILTDLEKRAEKGDSEVRHEVRLSPEEVSRRRDASTHIRPDGTTITQHVPLTEFVKIGALRGLHCFRKDVSLLAKSLEEDALYLLRNVHGAMEKHELKRVRDIMNRISNTQREVERAISDIAIFFADANLALLSKSPVSRSQGVVDIAIVAGEVLVTRRPGWGRCAA